MNPAKIIKGPNALSGRLRQATIPAKMYGSVIHQTSKTRSAGWYSSPLTAAKTAVSRQNATAASPRIHSRAGLGADLCRSGNSGRTAAIGTSPRLFHDSAGGQLNYRSARRIDQKTGHLVTGLLPVVTATAVEIYAA
jgi:hypothetical protein